MWSSRPDTTACCDGPYGAVANDETVARLLHSRIIDPDRAAFSRKELAAEGIPEPSNVCGDADGCSVDRVIELSVEEISARSAANAARREGREPKGAALAKVADLRSITHELVDNGQAVFVYDDPLADNARHAVIRVSEKIPRSDFKLLQNRIVATFSTKVG